MITAQRARELFAASDAMLDINLAAISVTIEKCATLGKRSFLLDDEHSSLFPPTSDAYTKPSVSTPMRQRIIEDLRKNGFEVDFTQKEHRFSGGFGSMEEPYTEMRWHIQVSW